MEQRLAHKDHNLEVGGSNPSPATNFYFFYMKTIVESIKSNSIKESTNAFELDVMDVKDLYNLIKNNKSGDFQDIMDDISEIIDMDNTTDREDDDIVKILELIRDHMYIFGPEGGYDGNGDSFVEVMMDYNIDAKIIDKTIKDVNDIEEYETLVDNFYDIGDGMPLPMPWLKALGKAGKFNCKFASYYIVSGYEFPCIICFDILNPFVKKFASSIQGWG